MVQQARSIVHIHQLLSCESAIFSPVQHTGRLVCSPGSGRGLPDDHFDVNIGIYVIWCLIVIWSLLKV